MQKTLAILTLLFASSCAAVRAIDPADADATGRSLTVTYGQQSFEDDAVADDVRADSFGITYEYVNPPGMLGNDEGSIVSEIGLVVGRLNETAWVYTPSGGASNEFDVQADTYELLLGLRKDWHLGRFTPFLGAGVDIMLLDVEALGDSDTDVNVGGYAKAGVRFSVSKRWQAGVGAQYRLFDDFGIGDVEGDLSGLGAFFSLTYGF